MGNQHMAYLDTECGHHFDNRWIQSLALNHHRRGWCQIFHRLSGNNGHHFDMQRDESMDMQLGVARDRDKNMFV